MITSEDFFRRCWLTLKAVSSSKMRKQMDDIEVQTEGIRVTPKPPSPSPSPNKSEENNGKPEDKVTRV